MERQRRKKEWPKKSKRALGRKSLWDSLKEDQFNGFLQMNPATLMRETGQYEIASALAVCNIKLNEAIESCDEDATAAWRQVKAHLEAWRQEHYRRSQQPSRFSTWAGQSYANVQQFNPRAR